MESIAWWPSVGVLLTAAITDLSTRRIPNWLSLPFLAVGIVIQWASGGWGGLGRSFAGISLALLLFGLPCCLRLMGMGDLKLALGVGAWIGAGQFLFAFLVASIVAGVMAALFALRDPSLGRSPEHSGMSLRDVGGRKALSIPYAPAFAIGTLFSFFAQ